MNAEEDASLSLFRVQSSSSVVDPAFSSFISGRTAPPANVNANAAAQPNANVPQINININVTPSSPSIAVNNQPVQNGVKGTTIALLPYSLQTHV